MAGERAFTASLARFFGAPRGARVPIGDDAAVVSNRARESVLCVDPVVEHVGEALRLAGLQVEDAAGAPFALAHGAVVGCDQ
mgnify:CR=1 FL=1